MSSFFYSSNPFYRLTALILICCAPTYNLTAAVPGATEKNGKRKLITVNAGKVGDSIVTSREVQANTIIEDVLYRAQHEKKAYLKGPRERVFIQEVTAVLLEGAIANEAKDLPLAKVTAAELQRAREQVAKKTKSLGFWKDLELSDSELDRILKTKISAKKFLEFKLESASLPVSDAEVETYYKNNRFKFDNASFESLKENIKSFLRKKQVDDRLREWFEVLKIKYNIRNQLAEKGTL